MYCYPGNKDRNDLFLFKGGFRNRIILWCIFRSYRYRIDTNRNKYKYDNNGHCIFLLIENEENGIRNEAQSECEMYVHMSIYAFVIRNWCSLDVFRILDKIEFLVRTGACKRKEYRLVINQSFQWNHIKIIHVGERTWTVTCLLFLYCL